MKNVIAVIVPALLFCSCGDGSKTQAQIDSLTVQLSQSYRPGFGEFMSNIQLHHAKLWFAGKQKNWPLADFEIREIEETVGAIQQYQKERKETQALVIIMPAIDSMKIAIQHRDPTMFVRTYTALTNTCNTCHQAVQFGFNVVKIPDTLPVTNQDFTVRKP